MKCSYKRVIKDEKGITMVALVMTIIVMLILAGITINLGKNGIKESKENAMLSEVGMIQNAVLQRKTKVDLTSEEYPGQNLDDAGINLDNLISEINSKKSSEEESVTRKDAENTDYYLLSNSNNGLQELGITNAEDEYIVNYKTGEVINYTTKVTNSGKPLYVYAKDVN